MYNHMVLKKNKILLPSVLGCCHENFRYMLKNNKSFWPYVKSGIDMQLNYSYFTGEDVTEKKAPDTTSSPALDPVSGDQFDGCTGGPDVHPLQEQDEPKGDTNCLHVVGEENSIVKKDSDDIINKPGE